MIPDITDYLSFRVSGPEWRRVCGRIEKQYEAVTRIKREGLIVKNVEVHITGGIKGFAVLNFGFDYVNAFSYVSHNDCKVHNVIFMEKKDYFSVIIVAEKEIDKI